MNLQEALAALAPGLMVAGAEGVPITNVVIDSRRATAGSLFVALRGERNDGHDYASQAMAAGATVVLVERPVEGAATVDTLRGAAPPRVTPPVAVVVPNALQALQRLAQARRQAHPGLRVVGITGSLGKTTTKEAVAAVLAQSYPTLKSAGNYNNEIGLPLTLLELNPAHRCAVLEMGMYALGEIATLCEIARPQVGVVTNVYPIHLERLGSLERIAQAKAELVRALPAGGLAVLNGDDARVRAMAAETPAQVVTFGLGPENWLRAEEITPLGLEGVRFVARLRGTADLAIAEARRELELRTLGAHGVWSALPAIAVGLWEGLGWAEIQQGLLALGHGLRLQPKRGLGGILLLDDTYNASPPSMVAALDALAGLPGRHVAVLGDMFELGAEEEAGHRQVGRRCGRDVDLLVTVGARARTIAAEARKAGLALIHETTDNAAAIALLRELLREGDVVLVKGSRGMAMEEIVRALEEPAP